MTIQFTGLVCVACDGELDLEIGYTGADWDSEAGEGSGFNYEVQLCCNKIMMWSCLQSRLFKKRKCI